MRSFGSKAVHRCPPPLPPPEAQRTMEWEAGATEKMLSHKSTVAESTEWIPEVYAVVHDGQVVVLGGFCQIGSGLG